MAFMFKSILMEDDNSIIDVNPDNDVIDNEEPFNADELEYASDTSNDNVEAGGDITESAAMATYEMNAAWASIMEQVGTSELYAAQRGRSVYTEAKAIDNLVEKFKELVNNLVNKVKELVNKFINWLSKIIGMHSKYFNMNEKSIEKGLKNLRTTEIEKLAFLYDRDNISKAIDNFQTIDNVDPSSVIGDNQARQKYSKSAVITKITGARRTIEEDQSISTVLERHFKNIPQGGAKLNYAQIDFGDLKESMTKGKEWINKVKKSYNTFKSVSEKAVKEAERSAKNKISNMEDKSEQELEKTRSTAITIYKNYLNYIQQAFTTIVSAIKGEQSMYATIARAAVKAADGTDNSEKKNEYAIYRGTGFLSDVPVI